MASSTLSNSLAVSYHINTQKISSILDGFAAGLSDPTRPPMRQGFQNAARIYLMDQRERFARASAGDGTWEPRKARKSTLKGGSVFDVDEDAAERATNTAADKASGTKLLRKTDRLYNAFLPGSSDNTVLISPQGFRVRLNVPYAIFHQLGTINLPRREVMVPASRAAKAKMTEALKAAARAAVEMYWNSKRAA